MPLLTKLTSAGLAVSATAGVTTAARPSGASDPKLYMFNNSRVVPGSPSLLAYDHGANSYSTVAQLPAQFSSDSVSDAAVVCGNTFYAVWAEVPIAEGIFGVDLTTGKSKIYSNGGVSGQTFHALSCGNQQGSLLALSTTPKSGGGLQFQLVNYDLDNEVTTPVGTFTSDSQHPTNFAGFDNGFRFHGNYLYATFPDNEFEPKIKSGSLQVMDTSSGKVTQKFTFPYGAGMPFGIYPSGNETFKGAFMDTHSQEVKLCDLDLSSGEADAQDGGTANIENCKSAQWLDTGSAPLPICEDGNLYALKNNINGGPGSAQLLTAVDLDSGATKYQVDMATVVPGTFLGAVAC